MGTQIEQLAQFVAETPWDAIPDAVWHHATLVVLDTLGVMLAGAEQPEVGHLRARLLTTAGTGATVLARGWPRSDPRTAALLNGIAARSLELCEGHRYVACQGAAQILPGVLAVGEGVLCSGRELLTALILGYEVAVRLGAALTARPLAHQNGQSPLLGAVAAGARVRGLNATETSQALRIGATLQGEGPDGKPVYPHVAEIRDSTVLLDLNHPLAGQTLHFDVKVVDIQTGQA